MASLNPDTLETSGGKSDLFVSSVEKAFKVLELYAETQTEMGLSDVTQHTGMGKSAAQRSLYTLCALGYLTQDLQTKAFRLSEKVLRLVGTPPDIENLKAKAKPILEQANVHYEETINLTLLEGTDVVYVLRFPSKHVLSVDISLGSKLPAFCTAPGRVLLAGMAEDEWKNILDHSDLMKHTVHTVTNRMKLETIIRKARKDGFAISDQESFVGDISIAAPVYDANRRVVAAVNMAVPYPRWEVSDVLMRLKPAVVECAERISLVLQA